MAKRKNYRYILCGLVNYDDPISDFRLIAGNNMMGCTSGCVRVAIPDDMKLEKWKCDSYSTTSDKRTLRELNAEAMVWTSNGWVVVPGLLDRYQPHEWWTALQKEGWQYNNMCYTKPKRYKKPKIMYFNLKAYSINYIANLKNRTLNEFLFFDEKWFLDTESPVLALKIELSPSIQLITDNRYAWKTVYRIDSFDHILLYKLSVVVRTESGIIDVTDIIGSWIDENNLIKLGWTKKYTNIRFSERQTLAYLNPPTHINN